MSKLLNRPFLALFLAASTPAFGAIVETYSPPTPIGSVDGPGDPDNVRLTYNAIGGYTLDKITVPAATLQEIATSTFAREAYIRVTFPGFSATLNPFSTVTSYTGTTSRTTPYTVDVTNTFLPAGTAVGFEFFEASADGSTGGQDGTAGTAEQNWTQLSFQFDSFILTAPTATDLGTLQPGTNSTSASLSASGETDWYKFTLNSGVSASDIRKYLDITITGGNNTDTEIGLYDANGNLVDTDDDDGAGRRSALSYGTGSGATFSDSTDSFTTTSTGQDGNLAAGTYYLAVIGYNGTFGASAFAVTPGTATGAYNVNFVLAPEPTSILSLAATGLLVRRRRSM